MSVSNPVHQWYNNSYGGPFRTTRLRAPSLLPPSRYYPHANAFTAVQQTLVVDAARHGENKDENKNVRRRETIFGPDVGEDDEPGWTKSGEGTKVDVSVVKGWVEKAKSEEGLHATTTLQATVNLKRPSLLLQQVDIEQPTRRSLEDSDIASVTTLPSRPASMISAPLHSLKFNYDATTPLVNIELSIYPSPPPVIPTIEGKEAPSILEEEPKIIYSGTHEGGFNQVFQLSSENALDLSSAVSPLPPVGESAFDINNAEKNNVNISADAVRASASEDTNRFSIEQGMGNMRVAALPDLPTVPEAQAATIQEGGRSRRRLGIFSRRNRQADVEAGGIELQNRTQGGENEDKVKEPENGMRLLIRIEAVGEEGQAMNRRNAQLTHILITGMWSTDATSTAPPAQNGKRVWVVKVVRREAIIGAHTFLLKEIYGLSSQNQTQQTSYPPDGEDPYASTPNECIVCLTSPRDVVLLPCRHLVVCRDCAVGMVEFGAGGKVGRRDDNTAGGEGEAGGADALPAPPPPGVPAPSVAGGTTTTGRERRKKKAKGWYCPVCRQPYTSLLRLALPSSDKPNPLGLSRQVSKAQSVMSTNSLRRVTSAAPTLPDGAVRMLDSLRPRGADDDEDDEEEDQATRREREQQQEMESENREKAQQEEMDREDRERTDRPQFVLSDEVDDADVTHRDFATRRSGEVKGGKGWKEV